VKRVLVVVVAIAATSVAFAVAAPKAPPPPGPDAAGPPTTLKSVARIARVRVEVSPNGAAVLHELVFPKDALTVVGNGQPTIYVAFTAQQRPLAIEATRHALDTSGAIVEAGATKVEVVDVFVRPKTAALVLGPAAQAGHVIRLPRDGAPFALRLRSAIETHAIDQPTKSISLLARLGVRGMSAMPLDTIEIATLLGGTLRGARATFCGPGADPRPLTVTFPGYPSSSADAGTISPSSALRTPEDDLCLEILE
jgi:hypothetical protein